MITWDLDHVGKVGKWEVLITDTPDVDAVDHLEEIARKHSGTVVSWSKVDRLLKDYSKPEGKFARKALERKIEELRDHLSMVYQRFLDPKDTRASKVTMTLNGAPVRPWDPFLSGTFRGARPKGRSGGDRYRCQGNFFGQGLCPSPAVKSSRIKRLQLPQDCRPKCRASTSIGKTG